MNIKPMLSSKPESYQSTDLKLLGFQWHLSLNVLQRAYRSNAIDSGRGLNLSHIGEVARSKQPRSLVLESATRVGSEAPGLRT